MALPNYYFQASMQESSEHDKERGGEVWRQSTSGVQRRGRVSEAAGSGLQCSHQTGKGQSYQPRKSNDFSFLGKFKLHMTLYPLQ